VTTCAACGAENASEARFCSACGAQLATPCAACGAPLAPEARFCSACGAAAPAEAAATAPYAERKLVTILFADVTGSTALGERLDPEQLREVLDTYFSAMREEIEAEGGTVEKFIGDAVMAAFGVPTAHEDDAARAVRAALRMLRRLDSVNVELAGRHDVTLEIRIGITTGEVLAEADLRPGEPMVTGDVVNVAARLQAAAAPGTVVVAERTRQAARGFQYEDLGTKELKGKAEPVRAHRVIGESATPPERGVPGLRAPMVGRNAELEVLRSVFRRVRTEGRPHLVTVYGEAGVGKSRLTREFLAGAAAPLVLAGRCLPYGDGITYWPLAEILKGHAGILDSDPPELALEKVRKAGRDLLTAAFTTDPLRATAALAYTVGLEDPEISFAAADPRDVRDELHAAWRSFFSAFSAAGPVITVIEDIHWADPALLDLLEELSDRIEGPVLFVCPSRPELASRRTGWGGGRRNASSVALEPLSPDESDRLVRSLLTIDDLPPAIHDRILERAGGNPFFLEEIVRALIDRGFLVHTDGRWSAATGIEEVEIPVTVQAVLASRIDLLEADDKRALQAAAVVGRVFWPGPVAALSGSAETSLVGAFRRLEARELVLSRAGSSLAGQPEFLFKHVLTRDVAYESLPRRDRAAAHRAVAAWIERTAGERSGEFAELLAYHYATALTSSTDGPPGSDPELRSAALRWLLRASTDARRRLVVRKAQRLAEQALDLAIDDEERVDALERLADAHFDAYEGDLAWRYFAEAARLLATSRPDQGERVGFLCARACEIPQRWPGSIRGTPPAEAEAQALYALGISLLPPGDTEARIRLLSVRAGWPFGYPTSAQLSGEDLATFEAAGTEAAEVALRMGNVNLASGALDAANAAWASIGDYAKVLPLWERRAALIPRITDVLELGDCYAMGAWVHFELAKYARALEVADAGLAEVTGRGANVELHLRAWRVDTLHRLGRWDEALEEFDRLNLLLNERRDDPPYFVTQAVAPVASIHELRGDRSQSDRLADVMQRITGPIGSGRLFAFHLRYLVVRGDLEAAQALPRPPNWSVHANDAYEADAELMAALGAWDEAPGLVATMRAHAEAAGTAALAAFADRLEGRSAMAAGAAAAAVELLERSAAGFDRLGASWERALSQVETARVLRALGRRDEAASVADLASVTFEELRDVRNLATARELSPRPA
jgi:class 3 adenylate cyclase/tetratricopeptide (TPR) repeat protein